ncbi:hypothetical protein Asppvi_002020 [Aspergillus pseudoviridinutans]|uniref:Uncharacterized protein n=1 Tax=Aspergillus pseudoviridinutans TaxID=1517512 RepID=A0A9P3BKF4_9EURO|nr:uncharacterized protein Asppvi_002020 [Aspergillus pseudoviridinutans]GIJ92742.1 hypothetical protein Asppvi_002020 [Aspergillus pseudoviridinutans]
MDDLEFVRVWIDDPELSPDDAVWHHNLDDVVKVIVPLPCQYRKLADFAVDKHGVERVLERYEAVRSLPLGSKDPMVLAQKPRDLTLKRLEACKQLRDAYCDRLAKMDLDDQDRIRLERQLNAQGRAWLERRLRSIVEVLDNLQNSVQTVRIWYPVCQGPLTQDAKDKGIGDMILAEVQLEDPSNGYAPIYPSHRPAGAVLVDLAVLPEYTATVRSKYLPVNFTPFGDDDPLVCSQPGENIDLKRALAFNQVFFRYDQARRIQQSRVQLLGIENELISNWFSRCMRELEGRVKVIHGCETIRIWCCSHQEDPMTSVRSKGLHDVVRAAVPLQDPHYRRVADDRTLHPDGAILVDLAVHEEDVGRVLSKYGVIDFVPMSNEDPVVLSQSSDKIEDKQIAAYEDMLERYSHYLREKCHLLSPMAIVWVAERLAGIENQLSVLRPNCLEVGSLPCSSLRMLILQTIRIYCPKYETHPWEIIRKLDLGDIVREAVPLEDQMSPQELVQVDLAVEPSGVSRVRGLCQLVEFQRLSEDDPIIQMQPNGGPHMKKFNGYNYVLQRYKEARSLRQLDGALMLWYEKEIMDLKSHIERLGYF